MKIIIILSILFIGLQANAADKWTKSEICLQVSSIGLQVIDWGMTLDIVDRKDEGYWEINPILGRHPSRGDVNIYFAISIASNMLVSHLLPSDWRKAWLSSRIIVSCYLIDRGHGIGLRLNF